MTEHLKALVQELLKIVSISAEDVILDIGSNDGTLLYFLSGEEATTGWNRPHSQEIWQLA
ncbi:MAG TPA: hypothetical protein VJ044_13430 [Candidatus Hodarchaeales archaeon]|nr:hypothetical protein [Candidatus Hodarchaeales archaeon]